MKKYIVVRPKKQKIKKHGKRSLSNKLDGVLNFSEYKKKRYKFVYSIIIFFLLAFAFLALIPIIYLFITSFKTVNEINSTNFQLFPEAFNFMKLVDLWTKLDFGKYYLNTLIVVAGAVVCAVIFNGLLAYAVGVLKPVGHKVINALILLAYMIPSALAIMPLMVAIKEVNMVNSYLPLCLVFGANAYYYMLFKDYFQKIPKSFIEAARIDGLGNLRIFFKVIIPQSKSIIGVVAIFAMTAAYSDFLLPYLVLQDESMRTVMVQIYRLSGTTQVDISEFLMLLVISIIPQIIIFFIFQKQIMGSTASSGIKE